MHRIRRRIADAILPVLVVLLVACAGEPAQRQIAETAAAKIPVTSSSSEAVDLYLQARDLGDKLRAPDARELYRQAVELDDGFALAHFGMATTSTSTAEFFAALDRALAAAENASDGERWMILATKAGADGDPAAQKGYLDQLADAYPTDERVQNLLGNWHFGRQEYDETIKHFTRATELSPTFSPPYNSLGYAQRAAGDNDAAEAAYKKYIELLPDEPNPYDSYAELLMRTGRYQESIENYQKALANNETFAASYVGIGNNQMLMGNGGEAREQFQKLFEVARDDGQRRQAMFWTAVSHLHESRLDDALAALEKRDAISAAIGDKATLAGDLNLMGAVLLYSGDPDRAEGKFTEAVAMNEQADVSDEAKEGTRRNHLFNQGRVAVYRDDLDTAAAKLAEYQSAVAARNIPFEVRRSHALAGMLALHSDDPETAVTELGQANQQDPMVLYLQAKACQQAGDDEGMRENAAKVANWNQLNLNLAFVKSEAEHLLKDGTDSQTSPAASAAVPPPPPSPPINHQRSHRTPNHPSPAPIT